MATVRNDELYTASAGEAFAPGDYCALLKGERENNVLRMVKATAAGDVVLGYLAELPAATGRDGEIKDKDSITVGKLHGQIKLRAASAIQANQLVVPAAGGAVAGVANLLAAHKAFCGVHGNGSYHSIA